ncbi:SAM-dependent methyltransferase [Alteromonadales bacterium alter-6D02]|nr:SAM-dependent methyltransferase [Alteromonadales bacterium alter-6D02]
MILKPAFNHRRVLAPSDWTELAQGEWLKQEVTEALTPWLSRVFGYHLLKIGSLSGQLDMSSAPIKHQVTVAPERGADLIADISRLPFQESCIDACVLTLSLNFHHNPHQLLREINRVTVPGGHIIIVGLNPVSPLGLVSINPQLGHKYPFNGRFFAKSRVKDWLAVLGYKVIAEQKLVYSSLLLKPQHTKYLQRIMAYNLPGVGSFYCIMAKKLVRPLTPVKRRWAFKQKPLLNPVATMNKEIE